MSARRGGTMVRKECCRIACPVAISENCLERDNSRIRKCLKETMMLSYLNWRKKVCYFQWSETHKMQGRDKKGGEANASPSWVIDVLTRDRIVNFSCMSKYHTPTIRDKIIAPQRQEEREEWRREERRRKVVYPLLITTYCRLAVECKLCNQHPIENEHYVNFGTYFFELLPFLQKSVCRSETLRYFGFYL